LIRGYTGAFLKSAKIHTDWPTWVRWFKSSISVLVNSGALCFFDSRSSALPAGRAAGIAHDRVAGLQFVQAMQPLSAAARTQPLPRR
jgi:hypothetical protein